jgi:Heavy metal associated domain 2
VLARSVITIDCAKNLPGFNAMDTFLFRYSDKLGTSFICGEFFIMETNYWHAVEGRLRIKVPIIKRSYEKALDVEMLIGSLDGVTSVSANPTTGNVLVFFCSETCTHRDIVSTLYKAHYLRTTAAPSPPAAGMLMNAVGQTLVHSCIEAVFRRALTALL